MLMMTACGGLPGDQVERAKAVPDRCENMRKHIALRTREFNKLPSSADWSFIGPYARKEGWHTYFGKAEQSVRQTLAVYEKDVMPILKENEKEKLPLLLKNMQRVDRSLVEAKTFADKAVDRRTFLLSARTNAPAWLAASKTQMVKIESLYARADSVAGKARISYPEKAQDIGGRLAALGKIRDESVRMSAAVREESEKIGDGSVDYARFGDAASALTRNLNSMVSDEAVFTKKTLELYRSYSKTLVDMRAEFYVKVTRTSWYEGETEFPTETDHSYTREVEEETYDYFDKLPDEGSIATYTTGWLSSGLNVSIDQNQWSELEINPKEGWPDGDNDSEFWVADTYTRTYHKYAIVENGQKSETGWISVPEDFYWEHENDLGLAIVSKPFGKYEDEADRRAHPPGMECIASPRIVNGQAVGSNRYGEWKSDGSGGSFWNFYGQYAFMRDMFSTPYTLNDWRGYSEPRTRSYYGKNREYGSFGQRTMEHERYRGSTFVQEHPAALTGKWANTRTVSAMSVRGSGPDFRSRGPGGGGK
jgi:hypothetical protein